MSFLAADTLIEIPGGSTAISKLKKGDLVLSWTPAGVIEQSIIFSRGVNNSTMNAIYITTENSKLIVGLEQKMLLDDQTLKKAEQLIPNKDRLLKSDGRSEEIEKLSYQKYVGGVYHVAIAGEDNLIIAAGFVCGDFKKAMEG